MVTTPTTGPTTAPMQATAGPAALPSAPGTAATGAAAGAASGPVSPRTRWVVLSNTTLGVFMAMLNQSIVIISLPAIFRGIHLDPLEPSNIGYLLWLLQGYMVVTAVLVVTLGRIGDIFGRVRMYNAGFAIFTVASVALAFMPFDGTLGASCLIALRIVQGIGGALLMANSTAILTDAFPPSERGMALGFNVMAAVSATFIGLVVGGLLADIDWRLVFLVSVPFGLFGTVWAYLKLPDIGKRQRARIDCGRQRHVRRRAHPRDGGPHLRVDALRRPLDGVDRARGWTPS